MTMPEAGSIVVATSIPPAISRLDGGKDIGEAYQRLCIRSWLECGFRVLSINDAAEIPALEARHPDVDFVPAAQNASAVTGRKNPYIADLLSALLATGEQVLAIVNSDILFDPSSIWRTRIPIIVDKAVVALQRFDTYSLESGALRRFYWGYDAFFFDKAMAGVLAESAGPFAMGLPWLDYWVPAAATFADRAFQIVEWPITLHLSHPQGYMNRFATLFERAFAEFVVSQAEKRPAALTSDMNQLVSLCSAWLNEQALASTREPNNTAQLEIFADQFVPWRRSLAERAIRFQDNRDRGPRLHAAGQAFPFFRNTAVRLRAGDLLDKAKHLESQSRWEDARRYFQSALELVPSDFGGLVEFGELLCRMGHFAQALAILEKARAQQANSPRLLNAIGLALRTANRREEAISYFRNALSIDPELQSGYYNLALTLFETERTEDAVAYLDLAQTKWPDMPDFVQLRRHFSESNPPRSLME